MDWLEPAALKANSSIPIWRYLQRGANLSIQAQQYKDHDYGASEYRAWFELCSLVVSTLPQHAAFKGMPQKQQNDYVRLRKAVEEYALPRCEELKPHIKEAVQQKRPVSQVRPGAARIQVANLPGLDWDSQRPASAAQQPHKAPPAHYFESNPTLDKQLAAYAQAAPAAAAAVPHQQAGALPPLPDTLTMVGGDPFAASDAYSASSSAASGVAPPPLPPPPANGTLPDVPKGKGPEALPQLPDWFNQKLNISAMPAASQRYQQRHSLTAAPSHRQHSSSASGSLHSAHAAAGVPARKPYPDMPSLDALDALTGPPQPTPPLPPQELQVTNQVAMEVPDIGPDATCDHSHPPEALPAPPGGAAPKKEIVDMRTIYLSANVMKEFLAYAKANTRRNIETCGVLAGVLHPQEDAFAITTLVIPKQRGEENKVEMFGEEDLCVYCTERDLLVLGWIHSHPTQTCFLSSIDVHTHLPYQLSLAEAVAIVVAPTDPRSKCGVFRLTTPGGMTVIRDCQERGFHMHPKPSTGQEIYELSGHVFLDESGEGSIQVADLRSQ